MTPFSLIEVRGARVIDNGFGCHRRRPAGCDSANSIKAKKIQEGMKETNDVMSKEERTVYSRNEAD